MPSPDELRKIAEEAKRLADESSSAPWGITPIDANDRTNLIDGTECRIAEDMSSDDALFAIWCRISVPALADAVLSLLQENERLRTENDCLRTDPLGHWMKL